MYRDSLVVVEMRIQRLKSEVALLRARGMPPEAAAQLVRLHKNRRQIARARRAVAWLRHPILRLVPRSMVEIMCSAGIAYAAILAAGLGTAVVCTLLLPFFG